MRLEELLELDDVKKVPGSHKSQFLFAFQVLLFSMTHLQRKQTTSINSYELVVNREKHS